MDAITQDIFERLRAEMQSVRNPDGDVHPCLFEVSDSGAITRVGIPRAYFSGRARKDSLTDLMVRGIRAHRPQVFAWSTTSYGRRIDRSALTDEQFAQFERGDMPTGEKRPLDPTAEDRIEQQHVVIVRRDGSAALYIAEITRDGRNPPCYGEWEEPVKGGLGGGAMVEPLQNAMKALGSGR